MQNTSIIYLTELKAGDLVNNQPPEINVFLRTLLFVSLYSVNDMISFEFFVVYLIKNEAFIYNYIVV